MKSINKRTIITSIVTALICFIISFAIVCPNIEMLALTPDGEPLNTTKPVDALQIAAGEISQDGTIIINRALGYTVLQFDAGGATIRNLEIIFSSIEDENVRFVIQKTADGTFDDLLPIDTRLTGEEKECCLNLGEEGCTAVRVWFYSDCKVERVSLYNAEPAISSRIVTHRPARYILVAIATLTALAAAFFIDKKFDLSGKFIEKIKKSYKGILVTLGASGIGIILGVLTELFYRQLRGVDTNGNMFNKATCSAFCIFFVVVAIFVTQRKNLAAAPEKAVMLMLLTFGTMFLIIQPFAHVCWDTESHYPWAMENSFFRTAYYSESDIIVDGPTTPFLLYSTEYDEPTTIETLNQKGELYVKGDAVSFSMAHLPSGVFIAVARLFGANFYVRYLFGRIANVIMYAVVCYFAIKKLKSGKMVASIIALFPTNIFLASNYSYDWWVTAFALLGTAYFVSEIEQPDKKMTITDTVIMCAAFMLASLPKLIYVMLFALPLFMFKKYESKRDKINYYAVWAAFFLVTLFLFAIRSLGTVGGTGDLRGGAVNPSEQVLFIFREPVRYAKMLLNFIRHYLSLGGTKSYIGNFAYFGTVGETSVIVVLLLFAAFTDRENPKMLKGAIITRIVAVLLLIGGASLIATALYIDFTPVMSNVINGCQPRYIIPLIAPTMLLLAGPTVIIKNRKMYNGAILGLTALSTWACIGEVVVNSLR